MTQEEVRTIVKGAIQKWADIVIESDSSNLMEDTLSSFTVNWLYVFTELEEIFGIRVFRFLEKTSYKEFTLSNLTNYIYSNINAKET